jgi:hypothetical protein
MDHGIIMCERLNYRKILMRSLPANMEGRIFCHPTCHVHLSSWCCNVDSGGGKTKCQRRQNRDGFRKQDFQPTSRLTTKQMKATSENSRSLSIRLRTKLLSRFKGVLRDVQTGFGLGDWIYWHLMHTTRNYRQYSVTADLQTSQYTVTRALGFSVFTSRILAADFITGSLSFQITHEVVFAQPNLFLAISSQSSSTADSLNSTSSCSQAHILTGWRIETELTLLNCTDHVENTASLLFRRRVYGAVA